MANYPFKINIQFKGGVQKSHYTASFATDAETSLSASVMVDKINSMYLADTYSQDNEAQDPAFGGRVYDDSGFGKTYLSASYTHPNTGSVIFTDTETTNNGGLDFYTFWGTKVCSVLGLPEGIPIYTETFKLSDDSSNPSNYLSGDVIADGVAIKESFKMAPQGRMRSNLVWDHQFGEGFLQWVSGSASKLLFGYDDQADTYSLSAATAATFNISGVDTLTADKVAADIIYDASGEDLVMVAGRTAWGSTAYDNGQLRLDSTHDQGGIARNQMIGGFRIDYQEHDAWDNESVLYDYGLRINNRTLTDAVDTFAGISFDVGTERDDDSIAGAIAVLRNDTTDTSHAGNMIFATNDAGDDGLTERLRITHDGNIGIGHTAPDALLDVRSAATSNNYVAIFKNTTTSDSGNSYILQLWHGQEDSTADFDSGERFINFTDSSGTVLGYIHSEVTYSTFTGAHVSQIISGSTVDNETKLKNNWKPGMIVKSTGNLNVTGSSLGLAWPEVDLTTTQKDKAVIGVFTDVMPGSGSNWVSYNGKSAVSSSTGDWGEGHNLHGLDKFKPAVNYNAIGEGMMLVTDTNGNIETGDYICSSARTGHGEKQDDDILHNYTVAKATQPIDFSTKSDDSDLGYKSVFIACTYHCG